MFHVRLLLYDCYFIRAVSRDVIFPEGGQSGSRPHTPPNTPSIPVMEPRSVLLHKPTLSVDGFLRALTASHTGNFFKRAETSLKYSSARAGALGSEVELISRYLRMTHPAGRGDDEGD
ncbi:uncharacterized protein V6R79_014680 [Siganus canaliculatus]